MIKYNLRMTDLIQSYTRYFRRTPIPGQRDLAYYESKFPIDIADETLLK